MTSNKIGKLMIETLVAFMLVLTIITIFHIAIGIQFAVLFSIGWFIGGLITMKLR